MTRHTTALRGIAALIATLAASTAGIAHAQSLDYGMGDDSASSASEAPPAEAAPEAAPKERGAGRPRIDITPYLGVDQVLTADLKGANGDVLTYTSLSAGVDANIVTRRAELAASVRYEHRIAWDDDIENQSSVTGVARGRVEVARGFNVEGGALATRTRADSRGAAPGIYVGDQGNTANIYSVYAGPTVTQQIGDLDVGAGYRFGYTKAEIENGADLAPGAVPIDTFDSSTNHNVWGSVGAKPGSLPFGWQVSGGWEREDASQLDQRFDGKYARADVTMPVGRTVALLAGVGYEDIEISQRAPLLDAAGAPVRGPDGRFVTDPASTRQLAFETDGLIYDAGVMWKPSRRTSLSAKVGRRYGDDFYSGSFTYQPTRATSVMVSVYSGLSSLGRGVGNSLSAMPTQFEAIRNPLDGNIGSCVFSGEGSTCLNPSLTSATSAQFRNRGVMASLSTQAGGWNLGLGGGFDQRKLLAPELLNQFSINGVSEENYYMFLSAARALDSRSDLALSGYLNYFDSGIGGSGDAMGAGASAAYTRQIVRNLNANAAVAVNAFDQDGINSEVIGSALVGLRYSF